MVFGMLYEKSYGRHKFRPMFAKNNTEILILSRDINIFHI